MRLLRLLLLGCFASACADGVLPCPAGLERVQKGVCGPPAVDECLEDNGGCDPQRQCIDTRFGAYCGPCPAGYRGDGAGGCVDVDECAVGNGGCDYRASCTNQPGDYACGDCPEGFAGEGASGCADIDECATDNGGCDPLSACINTTGSHYCSPCPTGYKGTPRSGCADIDECAVANGGCDPLSRCENLPGGWRCGSCPAGFTNDSLTGCSDIDECAGDHGCDSLTTCENTPGTFACGPCPSGYTGDGASGCVDIDECDEIVCDILTRCTNLPGDFECSACPAGYTGNGRSGCADVDECAATPCDPRTPCTNTTGSFTCAPCPQGFAGDGLLGCTDIDECAVDNGGCDAASTCTNNDGGFACGPCPDGFDGTGDTVCTPLPDTPPLAIAAFNVQVFGQSKTEDPVAMTVLSDIIQRYDLILIQEIRDASQTALPTLMARVNADLEAAGSPERYVAEVSDRLGRTSSKEQYAYVFRQDALRVLGSFHYDDGEEPDADTFEREPFVAHFEAIGADYTFAAIALHAAPGEAVAEIDALIEVFAATELAFGHDRILAMGDLNSDCSYVSTADLEDIRPFNDPDYVVFIDQDADTTTSGTHCAYDRFIATTTMAERVVEDSAAVFLYDAAYFLDQDDTLAVSDHYPVELQVDRVVGPRLRLITPEIVDEGGVGFTLTVERQFAALATALPVFLSVEPQGLLTFPDDVAIPASASSVDVAVQVVDNDVRAGPQEIVLRAVAAGHTATDRPMQLRDDEDVPCWLNELHYDNFDTDVGEGIELMCLAGDDLSRYQIILYNGLNGKDYRTVELTGTVQEQAHGLGTSFIAIPAIQNGYPDGFAIVRDDGAIALHSYEGTFTAIEGPAAGMESVDLGVFQFEAPVGTSLQLVGTGRVYGDFTWVFDVTSSFGAINAGQVITP